MEKSLKLRAGEWVEVRSKEEILSTLDKNGQLEALPFMPEMFAFCGKRLQVSKRAHKTCDPPNMVGRRMPTAVHLEDLRCGGEVHGGCQAGCLFFWKESWLKRVSDGRGPVGAPAPDYAKAGAMGSQRSGCTEKDVWAGTLAPGGQTGVDGPIYVCQATRVTQSTQPIPWWDLRQYVEDYTSGNAQLSRILAAFIFFVYHTLADAGFGFGSAMRWVYDVVQKVRGGPPYPWRVGKVPKGMRTPTAKLDLREGEMVRMKDYKQILETLDEEWKNRGLYFDAEMVPHCNGTYRVLKRVEQIIDEKTGRMLKLKTPALILDGVVCQARYAKCRKLCPRAYYQYCREIWLERVSPAPQDLPAEKLNQPAN